MKRIIYGTVVLLLLTMVTSCNFGTLNGLGESGNVIEHHKDYKVIVKDGGTFDVYDVTTDNLVDDIDVLDYAERAIKEHNQIIGDEFVICFDNDVVKPKSGVIDGHTHQMTSSLRSKYHEHWIFWPFYKKGCSITWYYYRCTVRDCNYDYDGTTKHNY